ncbi:MAG: ParA family protein [Anaerolineae bacterium]|nr:ParA family protein [Anaerolineae bacterium]
MDQNQIPFDFILLDTPPSLGLLTLNGLVGVTEVLVPVQCHYLAMRGVRALMETIWRVKRRLNPALRLLGLLPTMYDEDSIHSREVVTELRAVFGPKLFDVPVPAAMQFAEVAVAQQSLIEYDPDYEGVAPYWKLAEAVLKNDPGL